MIVTVISVIFDIIMNSVASVNFIFLCYVEK